MSSVVCGWRRRSILVAAIAAACVLASVVVLVVVHEDERGVADVAAESDPVPAGRDIESLGFLQRCGVAKQTSTQLVPAAKPGRGEWSRGPITECTWVSGVLPTDVYDGNRGLKVSIELVDGDPVGGGTEGLGAASYPATVFAESLPRAPTDESGETRLGRVKPLRGLGREAVTWTEITTAGYPSTLGRFSTVLYREGSVIVRVTYGGLDASKKHLMPSEDAFAGAMEGAKDVAASLRFSVAADPGLAKPSAQVVDKTPSACAIVPGNLRRDLGFDGRWERIVSGLLDPNQPATSLGCSWSKPRPYRDELTVEVAYASDSRVGTGTDQAVRRYFALHEGTRRGAKLHALTAPGHQAFAACVESDETMSTEAATVVFRVRNALVAVTLHVDVEGDGVECRTERGTPTDDVFLLADAAARPLDG